MTLRLATRATFALARRFIVARGLEILVLQASPLLGLVYGRSQSGIPDPLRMGALLLGSIFLTAHVFVFNDWIGYESDAQDPSRARRAFGRAGIGKPTIGYAALMLLAFTGGGPTAAGAGIALLSLVYSGSARFGKTPFAASANHLLGGSLHFLLGYTCCHSLDIRGGAISLFFGLVFAGGHLTQEVRDCEGDRLNGIRTCAVAFGCRRAFAGSVWFFALAYSLAFVLAALGILPPLLLCCPLLLLLHLMRARRALRRGLDRDSALWMQRQHRALFALVGLVMLLGESTPNPTQREQMAPRESPRPPGARWLATVPASSEESRALRLRTRLQPIPSP